ncbi:hypothetical protein ACFXKW_20750 [Streptomyces sp. NPDC059193]|uniref:DUF7224 domain-containing protein n=1 Tax=Streptomyces sp. NPDC059193 TaxID=3346763 RepID=UPI0036915C20
MLLRTIIRSSSATWLLPLLALFVVTALGDDLTSWVTPLYWPSATGTATFAQPFIAAACAAAGAWEGARLHRGRVFDQGPVRSPLAITFPALAPVVVMGLLALLVSFATAAAAADLGFGIPDLGILAVSTAMLIANTLAGAVLGRVLPGVLAAPLALVVGFIANAYPASWSVRWLRHIVASSLDNCCAVDQVVDPRALWSGAVFALAISCAALVLIHLRGTLPAGAAAVVLAVAGAGIAGYLARDVDYDPVVARPTAQLVCDDGAPKVCLWPELKPQAGMIATGARAATDRLAEAGLTIAPTLTMAAEPGPGQSKLGIPTRPTPSDLAAGVASGFLPQPPACALDGDTYPAGAARGPVAAWLYATATGETRLIEGRFDPRDIAFVTEKVLTQPKSVQLDWYQRNVAAMANCTDQPPITLIAGNGQ